MQKRLLILLLAILTAVSSALATPMVPVTEEQIAEALECLEHCAFTPEYGTAHNKLIRWASPLRISVNGDYTSEDLAALDRFIALLNDAVPHIPQVSRINSGTGNITVWFGPLDETDSHVDGYQPDNWGYAHYYFDGRGVIYRGQVAIATDVTTQRERNHLIQEELFCLLGLTNDHNCRKDSIIYQRWTDVQAPNAIDWLMLQMVYNPAVSPGMDVSEALHQLRQAY